MSEHTTEAAHEATSEALFSNAELREFESDDEVAGRAIGVMLSLLFIYTMLAMSGVAVWTAFFAA